MKRSGKHLAGAAMAAALCCAFGPRAAAAANACTNPGRDGPATSLGGIVNTYYPGAGSAAAGTSSVSVSAIDVSSGGASTPIAGGDLVLLMQMQDADINSTNGSAYGGSAQGTGHTALNNSGLYEYASVSLSYVSGASIPLTAPLKYSYRSGAYAAGSNGKRTFQVIRVPQYSSVVLGGTLTAAPWNGATGGVVVIDVAGQMSWSGQTIDVTGRGFRGGAGLYLKGRDPTQPNYAASDYVSTLAPLQPAISPNPGSASGPFPGSNGSKGEGIAGTPRYVFVPASFSGVTTNGSGAVLDTGVEGYPNGSFARGAPGNAGGGGTDGDPAAANAAGNDQNTGGGGGGGYATGGMGGYGWTPGTPPGSFTGGFGGEGLPLSATRLALGGGGGAGTSNNATGTPNYALASSGAPGGGVVLVRARTFTGSGTINANGFAGNQSVCNDASGGGGGGGSVLVFASGNNGNVGSLVINASGGMGGSNTGNGTAENSGSCGAYNNQPHGPGGGGGGGFVALSSISSATINVSGSANGTTSPSPTSTAPYGSSSSPGGYQISSVVSSDLPGASPSANCYPSFAVSKVTTQANTVQGGSTGYTITVTNAAGFGNATGVVVSDALPAPFTSAATTGISLAGGAVRTSVTTPAAGAAVPAWGSFSIPGGGSVTISFAVGVPVATALATYQNPAAVTYDDPTRTAAGQTVTPGGTYVTGDFVLGSNYNPASSAQEDVTVRMPATVSKVFVPSSFSSGQSVQLTISIANPNAVPVTSAAFTDTFPAGLTAVGGAVTVTGSGCTGFAPTVIAAGAPQLAQSGGTLPAGVTCTFSAAVAASAAGSYTNSLPPNDVSNSLNVTNTGTVSATLLAQPTIAKSFSPAAVPQSTDSTLSFVLTNPNSQALTGAAFTDAFPGLLVATGGAVAVAGGGCTGFLPTTVAANATSFALTAGTLPANASCTVSFAVRSATQGNYANTASGVTTAQTAVGAASNTAALGVGVIALSKAFAPARIASGGTATVTLTLVNPTGVAQTAGAFTDVLSGMAATAQTVVTTCTSITPTTLTAGQTSLAFTGVGIPGAGCTVSFAVTSSSVGTQTNTSGGVVTALLPRGPGSNTASLVVTSAPTISDVFLPATVEAGLPSILTFTLTNGDSIPLTGGSFTDTLNPSLFVTGAGAVTAGGTCGGASGNSFLPGAPGATLSFTGLTLPPGSCTVTIAITGSTPSAAAGYANASGAVTTNEAQAGAGSNSTSLVVVGPATIAKAFGQSPVSPGATSAITFTLANPSAVALTSATFTDSLTNMQIAAAGAATGTCAGAGSNSFTAGQTGTLTFAGLTVPASPATCTVVISVTSSVSGTNANTASGVTSAQTPVAGAPSNTANLVVYSPPVVTAGFSPGAILSTASLASSNATMTLTLTNPNAIALTAVAFTDALSPLQIFATGAAGGTCTGAAGNTFTAGATSLSFSGLTVPANGSCTVTVVIASSSLSPAAGWPAATSGATSAQTPLAGAVSNTAYLSVLGYATISKVFFADSVAPGVTSTITFTLTNPNSVNLTGAGFGDTLPNTPGQMTTNAGQSFIGSGRGTCTGAIPSAAAGTANSVTFSGILLPANSSCTVMVDVTAGTNGSYANTSSGVTTTQTGATTGPVSNTATLGVGRMAVAKSFSPASIGVGEKTTLTFTITSTVAAANNIVTFSDTFPAGMTIASPLATTNTCGGTLRNAGDTANSAAGDAGMSLRSGTMVVNGNCTITVAVVTSGAGSFSNTTGRITWGNGNTNTGPASNTALLTVVAKPTVAEAFAPSPVDAYRNSTLTFTLTNPNATGALTGCNFTDALTSLFVSNPPSFGGTCVGVASAPALAFGATSLNLTVPSLSPGSCTLSLPVTSAAAGTYTNAASGVKCNETVSAGAAATAAPVTFNKLPLQVTKSANLSNVPPGSAVTYTIGYANPNPGMALQGIVISDTTPRYTSFSGASCGPLPASITSCTVSAPAVGAAGTITWTLGGTLDAGQSGTVNLTITVN